MKRPYLLPLVPAYSLGQRLYDGLLDRRPKQELAWPVISVGNLSTGGTGKTPFTIALAKLLRAEEFEVDVLSRGYGRKTSSAAMVDPDGDASDYGDEPLLIAREAKVPVYVGASRFEAGKLAESRPGSGNKRLHLLDDGYQHRRLRRDIDIVLVNAEDLSDWLLPVGNLRESVKALSRADVLAVPVGDEAAVDRLRGSGNKGLRSHQPIWRFRREMLMPSVTVPAVAFCGIARPEQFFTGLEDSGVPLAARHAFPDHHRFEMRDIQLLQTLVLSHKVEIFLTTEKDRMRLSKWAPMLEQVAPLVTVGLRVVFEEQRSMSQWITARLARP